VTGYKKMNAVRLLLLPLCILRVYLPAQKQTVEVDRIELNATSKPRRWDFQASGSRDDLRK
jgi:hypothetical protein